MFHFYSRWEFSLSHFLLFFFRNKIKIGVLKKKSTSHVLFSKKTSTHNVTIEIFIMKYRSKVKENKICFKKLLKYGNEVTWIIHGLNVKIFCCCAYCCHEAAMTLINLFLMRNKVRFSIAQKIIMLNLNCRLRAELTWWQTHNKRF